MATIGEQCPNLKELKNDEQEQPDPVENAPVPVEPPKKERKTLKQIKNEFVERHPVAVRRAKKIGKVVLIAGAATVGVLLGLSEMSERAGYGGSEEPAETPEDSIPFEGSDLENDNTTVEE